MLTPTKQGVAQLVEFRIWSAEVGGSSPPALTKKEVDMCSKKKYNGVHRLRATAERLIRQGTNSYLRGYYCNKCKCLHLTSKPKVTNNPSYKIIEVGNVDGSVSRM